MKKEKNGFYTQVLKNRLKEAVFDNTVTRPSDALQQHFLALITKGTISTGFFMNKIPGPPSLS